MTGPAYPSDVDDPQYYTENMHYIDDPQDDSGIGPQLTYNNGVAQPTATAAPDVTETDPSRFYNRRLPFEPKAIRAKTRTVTVFADGQMRQVAAKRDNRTRISFYVDKASTSQVLLSDTPSASFEQCIQLAGTGGPIPLVLEAGCDFYAGVLVGGSNATLYIVEELR